MGVGVNARSRLTQVIVGVLRHLTGKCVEQKNRPGDEQYHDWPGLDDPRPATAHSRSQSGNHRATLRAATCSAEVAQSRTVGRNSKFSFKIASSRVKRAAQRCA
jgi:hypothetical protein